MLKKRSKCAVVFLFVVVISLVVVVRVFVEIVRRRCVLLRLNPLRVSVLLEELVVRALPLFALACETEVRGVELCEW